MVQILDLYLEIINSFRVIFATQFWSTTNADCSGDVITKHTNRWPTKCIPKNAAQEIRYKHPLIWYSKKRTTTVISNMEKILKKWSMLGPMYLRNVSLALLETSFHLVALNCAHSILFQVRYKFNCRHIFKTCEPKIQVNERVPKIWVNAWRKFSPKSISERLAWPKKCKRPNSEILWLIDKKGW